MCANNPQVREMAEGLAKRDPHEVFSEMGMDFDQVRREAGR